MVLTPEWHRSLHTAVIMIEDSYREDLLGSLLSNNIRVEILNQLNRARELPDEVTEILQRSTWEQSDTWRGLLSEKPFQLDPDGLGPRSRVFSSISLSAPSRTTFSYVLEWERIPRRLCAVIHVVAVLECVVDTTEPLMRPIVGVAKRWTLNLESDFSTSHTERSQFPGFKLLHCSSIKLLVISAPRGCSDGAHDQPYKSFRFAAGYSAHKAKGSLRCSDGCRLTESLSGIEHFE